jgi:hypothetical protein
VRFLKHALGQSPGKLLVVWDGSPIHRSKVVKEFLKSGAASSRLQLEQLPFSTPGAEPRRGDLEAPEVRGAQEHLLPEPLRVEAGVAQSQRALEAQEARHPRLPEAAGLGELDVHAEISKKRSPELLEVGATPKTQNFLSLRSTPSWGTVATRYVSNGRQGMRLVADEVLGGPVAGCLCHLPKFVEGVLCEVQPRN